MGLQKRVFTISIHQVFKGQTFGVPLPGPLVPRVIKVKAIETFTEGIKLEVGKHYHMNLGPLETVVGEKPATSRGIDLCDPPILWSDLTPAELAFLRLNAQTPVC